MDELHLVVGAALLGDGTRAFPAGVPASLRRLDTRTFAGSENLVVRYAVR